MAFSTIDINKIKVGDPITSDLLVQIKNSFDDHELRINSLATSGGTVFIFNGDVSLVNYSPSRSDIFYYTARQDFSINDFRVRLFTKDSISSGVLSFRLEKSNDPNNDNFATILTSDIEFDFATDVDYSEKIALLNASLNDITTGQILRIKVTNVPSGFIGKILLSIGAQ
jgi:hypothetical protein